MHRARKRSVAAAALAAMLLSGPAAWAFHAGSTFDKPPGAGGADGLYYTGSPLDKGWKCTLCHLNPPGLIKLHIDQPELFDQGKFKYTPDKVYTFNVDLVGEHLGMSSPRSNYNGLVVQILDEHLAPAGFVFYAESDFYSGFGPTTIASANNSATQVGLTHWTFKWKAPSVTGGLDGGPPGKVTMYFAVIDGNGADIGPNGTLTDPYGDDFFSVEVPLEQGPEMMGKAPVEPAPSHGAPHDEARERAAPAAQTAHLDKRLLPAPAIASVLAIAMLGAAKRSGRRRKGG